MTGEQPKKEDVIALLHRGIAGAQRMLKMEVDGIDSERDMLDLLSNMDWVMNDPEVSELVRQVRKIVRARYLQVIRAFLDFEEE